jgi:predicted anti-sigma-YlaC factor YlaD
MADELHPSLWLGLIPPLHLTAEEISGYLDAVVDLRSRQRIEAHLVMCDACLDEVIAVVRQLRPPTLPADD